MNLTYENGVLVRGATRGDDVQGEDVIAEPAHDQGDPAASRGRSAAAIEVRGKVYLPIRGFNELNERLAGTNQKLAPNPRNAAAGSLRQKNSAITADGRIDLGLRGG